MVGAQQIVAPSRGRARAQVAADVGAAERVDRLLGVADQEQRGGALIGGAAVKTVEEAELARRGVLELIDQRHRVLLHDAFAQARAVGPGQRGGQALDQVGKAVDTAARLQGLDAPRDIAGHAQAQRIGRLGQAGDAAQHAVQGFEVGRDVQRAGRLAGLVQALQGQALAARRGQRR